MADFSTFSTSQLSTSQIDLWLLDCRQFTPAHFSAATEMMSPREYERAQKMLRGKDEFIASRWLIRSVLARYTAQKPDALAFAYSTKGKPMLSKSDLHFSLSHSGPWALLAVGKQKWLGVDIEYCQSARDLSGIAQSFFHPEEFQQFNALSEEKQADFFYQLWTLKEAFFKAVGSGISAGLEKIHFSLNGENINADISPSLNMNGASASPCDWQFYQTAWEPGVRVALAYQASQPAAINWCNPLAP